MQDVNQIYGVARCHKSTGMVGEPYRQIALSDDRKNPIGHYSSVK